VTDGRAPIERGHAVGVLFDMDGVLAATEGLKAEAHAAAVRDQGGTGVTPELYRRVMGRSYAEVSVEFARGGGIEPDRERYDRVFRETYRRLLDERLRPMPGATELVEALADRGLRLAAVSSSERWMMDRILTGTGLERWFAATVSSDDVTEEKPAAEPYVEGLQRLGLSEDRAVAVEDTEAGVASARAAGLAVIAIRHEYNGGHDLGAATAVLSSLLPSARTTGLIVSILEGR
jgi:HAD superfamily hydrolase (TIGR01509 family)